MHIYHRHRERSYKLRRLWFILFSFRWLLTGGDTDERVCVCVVLLPWRNPSTGGLGGGVHVLAGVRDVRGGGDLRQRQGPHIAAGTVGRRRAHRHGDDLRRRPHLRRAHEPRRHARVRRVPPFPLDSGTRSRSQLLLYS